MTVGDLKRLLSTCPDDTELVICIPARRLHWMPDLYQINHLEKIDEKTVTLQAKVEDLED